MRADYFVDAAVCQDFARSSQLEWLDTNGKGAYAMGTVAQVRTRRYHSLLNAPTAPANPTQVWLSSLDETLLLDGRNYPLGAEEYEGQLGPKGFELLGEFRLAPYPCWLYRIGESTLAKEVLLIDGLAAVLVRYCCSDDAVLSLQPFIAGRPQHHLLKAAASPWQVKSETGLLALSREDASLYLRSDAEEFVAGADWFYRFEYSADRERGLDHTEDLWTPGALKFQLRADTWAYFVAGLEDPGPIDPMQAMRWVDAKEKRFPTPSTVQDRLRNAGEHYVFQSGARRSVIAGYPWFTDWGRDTFLSLPGLFLTRKRNAEAADVIESFIALRRDGLIPNRITDDGSTPEYNSVDATLWLYIGVWQWLRAGGDRRHFQDRFYAPLRDMLLRMASGTIHAIHCDGLDGLLNAGTPKTQLTWMDARINGEAVTPRFGKAVEINALWYNALRMMTDWARERGEYSSELRFGEMANRAIASFGRLFWNPKANCLYDVIRPGLSDARVRPNQLLALSLPFPLMTKARGAAILDVVEKQLLTPLGLRTLDPDDRAYRGRFEGGMEARDRAYHQGSVWPWLTGPYIRACLRMRPGDAEERRRCRALLNPLLDHLEKGCLGQLPELFDGDLPQRAGGTPAQAWSVAEILWLLEEELAS